MTANWTQQDQQHLDHLAECRDPEWIGEVATRASAALTSLREENARLREALQFYAANNNWQSPSKGFALQYDPEPAPAHDYGRKARAALSHD